MDRLLKLDVGATEPAFRVRAWEQLLRENLIGLECLAEAEGLRASVVGREVDNGAIARTVTSRQTLLRTPELIRACNEETALVAVVVSGTLVLRQGEHSWTLTTGDLCIVDGTRPYEAIILDDMTEHRVFVFPRRAITRRVRTPLDPVFGAYGPDKPLQILVAAFLQSVVSSLDQLDIETLNALLDQILDLLTLMVEQGRRANAEPSTHRAGTLARIKAFVAANLRDDELAIAHAARALGISSRYINSLLASEGTSFGRYVLAQRLEGARREIMDPRRVHMQITEVAFGWGFNSASHFGRVYKDRFGMTPREAKSTRVNP